MPYCGGGGGVGREGLLNFHVLCVSDTLIKTNNNSIHKIENQVFTSVGFWYHPKRDFFRFCFRYRKICKTCKCGAADHDIKSDEDFTHQLILRDIQQLVTGPDGCGIVKDNIRKFRLASTGSEPDVFPKGNFLWVPSGVTKEVVGRPFDLESSRYSI